MKEDKVSPNDEARHFKIIGQLQAAILGIATAVATFWLQLRDHVYESVKKTGKLDNAIEKFKEGVPGKHAGRQHLPDDASFSQEYSKARKIYKEEIGKTYEKLGLKGAGVKGLRRRLAIVGKADTLEAVEKAGGFGFMAAALVVGLGVVAKMSRNEELKEKIEKKNYRNHLREHPDFPYFISAFLP